MTAFYGYWLSTTLLALRYLAKSAWGRPRLAALAHAGAGDNPLPHGPIATTSHHAFQHAG